MTAPESKQPAPNLEGCREALWRRRVAMDARHEAGHRRAARLLGRDGRYQPYPFLEAFLRLTGLYARGFQNALRPVMRRLTFEFPNLPPSFHGFRLLHVSDLHIAAPELPRGPGRDFSRMMRDFLATVEADLCVMTGDCRFEHFGEYGHVLDGMRQIVSGIRSRHGILAAYGNHDRSAFLEPFRAMGIGVLLNEHTELVKNGERIWIAGVDDPHKYRCDHLELALDGIRAAGGGLAGGGVGEFVVLLIHSPERVREAAAQGVSLYLCGHTHGGQISLPWIGPIHLNARCRRRFAHGVWRHGALQGYTTAGLGTTDVPVRFNCPPEAALIELRRG